MECHIGYTITTSEGKDSSGNKVTLTASPNSISSLTGTQKVTVTFKKEAPAVVCPTPATATLQLQPIDHGGGTGTYHMSSTVRLSNTLPVDVTVEVKWEFSNGGPSGTETIKIPAGKISVTQSSDKNITGINGKSLSGSITSASPASCVNIGGTSSTNPAPSTMNITVTRNGDRVSPNGNFGYFYDFSINWDTGALEPVKFVVSGNYYRTNAENPSAANCGAGSVGTLDRSGTSLRFLYEKSACTLNQTTGGGTGHIFLEDFYCRIIIGSQEFKCNYSGTTTIDGVTVNVKNNTNDVYDNGDRSNMWGGR